MGELFVFIAGVIAVIYIAGIVTLKFITHFERGAVAAVPPPPAQARR